MQTKDYFSTKFLYFLPISDIKPDHHRTVVDMTYKAAAEDGLQGTEDDGVYLRCCFLFLLLVLGTRGVGGCPLGGVVVLALREDGYPVSSLVFVSRCSRLQTPRARPIQDKCGCSPCGMHIFSLLFAYIKYFPYLCSRKG